MRRTLVATLACLLLAAALPASADEGGTYLALGDSVAAGTQQPEPFTDDAYTDRLASHLRDRYGVSEFVKLACPGDDTVEMIYGGGLCYPVGYSQLDAATDYLTSHPGEVDVITITMGANDILKCDTTDPNVAVCVAQQLQTMGQNLAHIIGTLKAVAPDALIVGMNYYNPNLAFWLVDPAIAEASMALVSPFNGTLEAVYGALGVPVADVETTFQTFKDNGQVPQNVRIICSYTLMCEKSGPDYVLSDYDPTSPGPQTDIHPSDLGYIKIADAFKQVIDPILG